MAHLYHVTAHKPDSVSVAVRATFTGPDDVNLVVGKCTHFELYLVVEQEHERLDDAGNPLTVQEKSLRLVMDVPIYGRIANIKAFRPENRSTDLLFVSTEKYKVFVLSYDADSQRLITEASGDIRDPKARPADAGQVGLVDPFNRVLGLHISQGTFKVIPMYHSKISDANWTSLLSVPQPAPSGKGKAPARGPTPGEFGEAFNVRLDELLVLSITFLYTSIQVHPTLAILYQDSKETRHLVQYDIVVKDKKIALKHAPVKTESGASMLIPVPLHSGGGVLVVGEQTITLHSPMLQQPVTLAMRPTLMKCYNRIDDDGLRYLLSDYEGNMFLLFIQLDDGIPHDLKLEYLGQTAQASALAYLTDGYVFVGSHFGDSELYSILEVESESGSFLALRESFPNLAPITDFCVVDVEKQGQEQIVACSGAHKDGSLRIIRNGIGVEEIGQLEDMQELTGVWALRPYSAARHDSMLVLSFINETRFQMMEGEAMAEVEDPRGFSTKESTLCCQNMPGDVFIQVTPSSVVLIACEGWMVVSEWSPESRASITHASVSNNSVLVSLGGGSLVLLQVSNGKVSVQSTTQIDQEISCLYITKLDQLDAPVCAIGCWGDNSVRLLRVPSLSEIEKDVLSGETIPRSIMMVDFDMVPYLLVSLGDGQLFNYHITKTYQLVERKKITLGTQPISLRSFQSNGRTHVFAASDRPTVIHSKSGQLLYSNVNMREVTHVSPFSSSLAEGALALACEGILKIGTIETVQKLHIKTVKLGETVRRIAHHEASGTFGVLALQTRIQPTGELAEVSFLRLLDSQSFDVLDSVELHAYELASSLMVAQLSTDGPPLYIVGTGFAFPHEDEPTRGRILVLTVTSTRQLRLVHEYEIRGSAYSLTTAQGKLIAGVNSKVLVLRWNADAALLELESTNHGHVLALTLASRGDFVLVGDLMKSVTLLALNAQTGCLEEVARDHDTSWMTAVGMVDDDLYIGADSSYNLFAVRRRHGDAETEEERQRLGAAAHFHIGELVNRFRHGSLTMRMADQVLPASPELLYCTVSGTIGVIATVTAETFAILDALQDGMRHVVQGVGGLEHAEWRRFVTERKQCPQAGMIDGDLVETFLELNQAQQEQVEAFVTQRVPTGLQELIKLVEDLTRIH
ncbi:mono-functional DNA-alkylating methyl methanesulfonate N-term-domain-containing protein [Entophlyctis helioformis]|nr:mono-functional DNA-alkylating methyl methanesulfonate N-term-domain-containing protein [Entophlyctis helioformis]